MEPLFGVIGFPNLGGTHVLTPNEILEFLAFHGGGLNNSFLQSLLSIDYDEDDDEDDEDYDEDDYGFHRMCGCCSHSWISHGGYEPCPHCGCHGHHYSDDDSEDDDEDSFDEDEVDLDEPPNGVGSRENPIEIDDE